MGPEGGIELPGDVDTTGVGSVALGGRRNDHADLESDLSGDAVAENLVGRWAKLAVQHAAVRRVDDPDGVVATVAGVDGAWGFGSSREEALEDLESVLFDWASLKLEDGDDDIPIMEGVKLAIAQ